MIIASCPLRVSLFGGSTDNPYFVEEYGRGSVISFTSSLKTYVTITQDKFGFNREQHKYIINYSRREKFLGYRTYRTKWLELSCNTLRCHHAKSL